jgi:hypothetical protein
VSPELERLIGRAVVDKEFRTKLFDDPDGTVQAEGFKLDPGEMDQVREAIRQRKQQGLALDDKIADATAGATWA